MHAGRVTISQCVVRFDDPTSGLRLLGERPLLWWLLREFSRYGVSDFLLLTDMVSANVSTGLPRQVGITLAALPANSGTGGALFHVRGQLQDRFLLVDGGRLYDRNLAALLADAAADEADVIGRSMQDDTGVALFRNQLADHLRPVGSLEADVLPDLAKRGLLRITAKQDAAAGRPLVSADVADRLRRSALFLDRDGVLNIDRGYVGSRDRFEWTDGALDAIRYATEAGWHVFLVTNQSGVARGLFSEDAVRGLLDWMADEARRAGGTIDDLRFCPFHPAATVDAYRQAHPWRKPMPGMLLDLIRAWELDPRRALMIGDQQTDMAAARAAGVQGHLFAGGNLLSFVRSVLDSHGSHVRPDPC